jgi:4-amino-4-deoxy-L-arabinose transferase-like glycosyltransferase
VAGSNQSPSRFDSKRYTFPIGLCLLSVCLGILVAWGIFDAMPHLEDEGAQYYQAKVFAAGQVVGRASPVQGSFDFPFILHRDGRLFSKYPPGFALLLAPGMLAGLPWLVNPLLAGLGILGVYLLGRDLFDASTGILAAALGVISPLLLILSGTFLAHTASLAVLTLAAWSFWRARRTDEPRPRRFALASGALFGLALITRPYTAAAIGAPFALLALLDMLRSLRRRSLRQRLPVYLWMAAACALVGALLPLYNWVAAGSPLTNTYTLWWPYDSVGFGPAHGPHGHSWSQAVGNFNHDFPIFGETLVGWPIWQGVPVVWGVVGLGLLLHPWKKSEWGLLLPAAALIGAHLAYWAASGGLYGVRYYTEAAPFLWLLVARGLIKVSNWTWPRRLVKLLLPVWMLWGLLTITLPRLNEGRDLYHIDRRQADQVAAAGLHRAVVFVVASYWTDYANLNWLNPANLEQGDVLFAYSLGEEQDRAVLAHFPGRTAYLFDRTQDPPLRPYDLSQPP